jgi:6-pyruvoyltetrahydropterin/6-carboxytetrahydropterin synthase
MPHYSTKTYGHDLGISCAFRQWRANHSHCQYLHGYALKFKFIFGCTSLDERNWCMDFGNLKRLKNDIFAHFDHKTVVADDDPELEFFQQAEDRGLLQLTILPAVGCEKFAEYGYKLAEHVLELEGVSDRIWVVNCEVAEHDGNSAIYIPSVEEDEVVTQP